MTQPTDQLLIQIRADTKQLRAELGKVKSQLSQTDSKAKDTSRRMVAAFGKAKIAAAALAVAAGTLARASLNVVSTFEDLRLSLNVVFGSMQKGGEAFDRILEFAQTTPFQIETVTRAFISLKSAGIEPNAEQLQIFADTASIAIDKVGTFEALIRTVQRAASGGMQLEELNMLDDRGIPAIKILMDRFGKSKQELSEFGKTAEGSAIMVQALTEGLAEMFPDAMETQMNSLSTLTSNLSIAFKQLQEEIGLIFTPAYKDMIKGLTDMFNAAASFMEERRKAFEENLEQEFRIKFNIDDVPTSAFNWKPSPTSKDQPTIVPASQEEIGFLTEFQKLVKDSVPEAEQLQAKIDLINDAVKRGVTDKEGNPFFDPDEAQKVTEMLGNQIKELNEVTKISDILAQTISDASQAFTQEFTDALLNGENALDSFNNFAKNIVSQIIATFLQLAVVNKILNQIFGAGTFDTYTVGEGITKAKKAGGGAVQGKNAYLVGERGPEIFVPNTGGTIMNNMNSRNAMGGGTPVIVNQSVNFSTGVVPTVRAEVTKMLPQISDVTKGAVLEAAMRGGSYRRGLQGG